MPQLSDLITNKDKRLSTTTTVQFLGFLALAGVMVYSVWLDRSYVPDLFTTFAVYCGGLVVSKGAVTAYRDRDSKGESID